MKCNIDARGKLARLIWGIVMLAIAVVVGALTYFDVVPQMPGWIGAGALFAFGVFAIYEARAGWCAMRAMGFKTRM